MANVRALVCIRFNAIWAVLFGCYGEFYGRGNVYVFVYSLVGFSCFIYQPIHISLFFYRCVSSGCMRNANTNGKKRNFSIVFDVLNQLVIKMIFVFICFSHSSYLFLSVWNITSIPAVRMHKISAKFLYILQLYSWWYWHFVQIVIYIYVRYTATENIQFSAWMCLVLFTFQFVSTMRNFATAFIWIVYCSTSGVFDFRQALLQQVAAAIVIMGISIKFT